MIGANTGRCPHVPLKIDGTIMGTMVFACPWCEIERLKAEVSRLGVELKDCTRERDKRKLEGDVMTEQCAKEVKYANDLRDLAKTEWERAEVMAKALKWALYYGAHRDRRGDFFSRDGMTLTPPKEFREVLRVLFSAPANEESER